MKVRQGFVSNSSSSSFVAIVEKKDFEKYIKSCHEYIKFMLKDGYSKKEAKLAGKEFVIFSGEDNTEDGINLDGFKGKKILTSDDNEVKFKSMSDLYNNDDYPMQLGDCLYKMYKALGKKSFYSSEGC